MKLTIGYFNGEQRIINLTRDFFASVVEDVHNKRFNKIEKRIVTPAEKAVILANSLAPRPHTIILDRDGQIQYKKIDMDNFPIKEVRTSLVEKEKEAGLKATLKMQWKKLQRQKAA